MEAFGIFEGGGVKALAHIGALKASEEKRVEFIGLAGTSAGAIVAALVAVGYKADDLYNPENDPRGRFDTDFVALLDAHVWAELKSLISDATGTFGGSGAVGAWCKAPFFYRRNRRLITRLFENRGLFGQQIT